MHFEWDKAKRAANLARHGVDFSAVDGFDFAGALVMPDDRIDYGELRHVALGFMGRRLHVLIFTWRSGVVRVISLRKANKREMRFYERSQA